MVHKTRPAILAIALLAGVLAAGCLDSSTGIGDHPDWSDPTQIDYYPGLGIDIGSMSKTTSGVYYEDVTVGSGEVAQAGDSIYVHFDGYFPDGTRFGGTQPGSAPVGLNLATGTGGVIQGWADGIPGMREGGERKLVIPPALAYGPYGSVDGTIPGNVTLVFDIQLDRVVHP